LGSVPEMSTRGSILTEPCSNTSKSLCNCYSKSCDSWQDCLLAARAVVAGPTWQQPPQPAGNLIIFVPQCHPIASATCSACKGEDTGFQATCSQTSAATVS
jgi:hypothetical protein